MYHNVEMSLCFKLSKLSAKKRVISNVGIPNTIHTSQFSRCEHLKARSVHKHRVNIVVVNVWQSEAHWTVRGCEKKRLRYLPNYGIYIPTPTSTTLARDPQPTNSPPNTIQRFDQSFECAHRSNQRTIIATELDVPQITGICTNIFFVTL